MTTRRQAALLLAFCCLLYLPGLTSIRLYTRGEAREALAVREVVQSGRWLVPMRPGGQLTKKPPLFYWLGTLTWRLVPSAPEAAVRLPSALAGTIGVLAVALLGHTAVGSMAAVAALVLATSFEWVRAATSARVDMLLSAAMTLVLLGWTARLSGRSPAWTMPLVGVGTALAVLAKGPIGAGFPAIALVATALVTRDASLLRLLVPVVAGAAAAGVWYVAAWLAHGRAFLDVVLAENLGRFVDTTKARTGHAQGPILLMLTGLVGFLPWTPLVPLVAAKGMVRPPIRTLLLAWIAVILTVVLLSSSKRPVYLLPIFPAVAMLIADGLAAPLSPRLTRVLRATTAPYAPVLVLLALVLLALAAGVDFARLLEPALAPDDVLSLAAIGVAARGARWAVAAVALSMLGFAVAVERAHAAQAWRRLVALVAGATAVGVLTLQVGIRPVIARTRGFADFMVRVGSLVPPGEPLYAHFPADQGVRFYAPRPVARWQERPGDRDVYLLAWEREALTLRPATGQTLERLATSEARHGTRGPLVLLRVPRGALPPRRGVPAAR